MDIFITGASGYIGGTLAHHFKKAGHNVRGLVRTAEKADRLSAEGIQPVMGDLDSAEILRSEARRADAVVNAASSDHRGAVEAMLDALQGSFKPFVHTSGSSVIGDVALGNSVAERVYDDITPFEPAAHPARQARYALDMDIVRAARDGIRTTVLCNSLIYGQGHFPGTSTVFIDRLMSQARASGVMRVIGKGLNRWSTVHIEDLCDIYALALERSRPGNFYFVENGEASFAEIGGALAKRFGWPLEFWPVEEAVPVWGEGLSRFAMSSNSRVRGVGARRDLGWVPHRKSIVEWIGDDMTSD